LAVEISTTIKTIDQLVKIPLLIAGVTGIIFSLIIAGLLF
jgi:hypothetical protein